LPSTGITEQAVQDISFASQCIPKLSKIGKVRDGNGRIGVLPN